MIEDALSTDNSARYIQTLLKIKVNEDKFEYIFAALDKIGVECKFLLSKLLLLSNFHNKPDR